MQERIAPLEGSVPSGTELYVLENQIRRFYDLVAVQLDQDDVESFPDHFIEDCVYQVVSRENYDEGLPQAAIYCDGIGMVRDRVVALRETQVYVPRVWRHFISGVRVTAVEQGDIYVRSNFLITEAMSDSDPTIFLVGEYLDVLVNDVQGFKFKQRLAVFDNHHVNRSLIVPV